MVHRFRGAMPGADIHRGFQGRGGEEAPDVEVPIWWVECKHGKRPSIRNALKQADGDCPKGRVPIAIVKDDRLPPTVTMSLDDFLEFVSEWWAARK